MQPGSNFPKTRWLPTECEPDSPSEVVGASLRYEQARKAASEAYEVANRADQALTHARHADAREVRHAVKSGTKTSTLEATAPAKEHEYQEARSKYESAVRTALEMELAFADAVFDNRESWRAEIQNRVVAEQANILSLIDQLETAIAHRDSLKELDHRLSHWEFDSEASPRQRIAALHADHGRSQLLLGEAGRIADETRRKFTKNLVHVMSMT